jgi:hypothetical protein
MVAAKLGALAIFWTLVAPAAFAQGAPAVQLVKATGVGGCIFDHLPEDVRRDALIALLSHQGIGKVLKAPVAGLAVQCTGQPLSGSDSALVGSVFSVFWRTASAYALGTRLHIPEQRLVAAWTDASAAQKAPFLSSAKTFLSPGQALAPAPVEAANPFGERLGLADQALDKAALGTLAAYYSAMALSELSERDLAARGARPLI